MFLTHTARRTGPVLRQVFKSCSRRNIVFRVSFCRIINVSAEHANISFHIYRIRSPTQQRQQSDRKPLRTSYPYLINEIKTCDIYGNFIEDLEISFNSLTLQKTLEIFRVYLLSSFYIRRGSLGRGPRYFSIYRPE